MACLWGKRIWRFAVAVAESVIEAAVAAGKLICIFVGNIAETRGIHTPRRKGLHRLRSSANPIGPTSGWLSSGASQRLSSLYPTTPTITLAVNRSDSEYGNVVPPRSPPASGVNGLRRPNSRATLGRKQTRPRQRSGRGAWTTISFADRGAGAAGAHDCDKVNFM